MKRLLGKNCSFSHCFVSVFVSFHIVTVYAELAYSSHAASNIKQIPRISELERQKRKEDILLSSKFENNRRKAGNFFRGFEDFQIVVPIRLDHVTGLPVSHGRHFRKRANSDEQHQTKKRKKRDADDKTLNYFDQIRNFQADKFKSNLSSSWKNNDDLLDSEKRILDNNLEHSVANYSFFGFGEEFVFYLTPYHEFLAPNYNIRFLGESMEREQFSPDSARHCFYSGIINGNPDHQAVFSLCKGMFGTFRTHESEYLIQLELSDHNEDDEGAKPHKLFRRSTRSGGTHGKLMCGHVGDESENFQFPNTANERDPTVFNRNFDSNPHRYTRRKSLRLKMRKSYKHKSKHANNPDVYYKQTTRKTEQQQSIAYSKLSANSTSLNFIPRNRPRPSKKTVASSRKKRYISLPRTVEVMVTADNEMFNAHYDVEHYVLTLMAIVSHIFREESIGNLINIVVVELIVIGDSQAEIGLKVEKDAHLCLRNFCEWQHKQNNPDDSHPTHYDTAVLITGKDLCRSETACDTLGLAELGTICDSKRSCSINEDNGLSTAFTIAHEIGHLFNAPHDNSVKCFDTKDRTTDMNVMSPTLDNNAHPWKWSECSASYITEFLDDRKGDCLLDKPPKRLHSLPIEEPGQLFGADEQCEMVYGKGSTHCDFMFHNSCQRLWCTSKDIVHGCKTPHLPWADGTSCGNKMWCQRGACVPEDRHRLPLNGDWGEWGEFGDCSRTCGGGVKISQRKCNDPKPNYGGEYCIGRRKRFRSCNVQACSKTSNIRAEQCSFFNDWSNKYKHRIRGIPLDAQWIPKYDGIMKKDRCKLTCQLQSNGPSVSWYVLRSRVINGTPCGPDSHNICVEGVCQKAGCDHILESTASEDECGICKGNGTSCRQVNGSFNAGSKIGYNFVTVVPAGANRIYITQQSHTGNSEDNNYLALRETNGDYILNGNRSVMKSKQKIQRRSNDGSGKSLYSCLYSGTDSIVETINCSMPTSINITLEILAAGDLAPPNVNFQYNVPIKDNHGYHWFTGGTWLKCSKECNGKTTQRVSCLNLNDEIVFDQKCSDHLKPAAKIRSCNTHCDYRWRTLPSKCSTRCGRGTIVRLQKCWKVYLDKTDGQHKYTTKAVSDIHCVQRKPQMIASCHGDCLPTNWTYGEWSECSVSCGNGVQTREKTCLDSKGKEFDFSECNETAAPLTRTCTITPCPKWLKGAFSPCSVTCGGGWQSRRVWCSNHGITRPDEECDPTKKPTTSVSCNNHGCPHWEFARWSECSVTCGLGSIKRIYQCVDHSGQKLFNSFCGSIAPSSETQSCSLSRSCDGRTWNSEGEYGFPLIVRRNLARRNYYSSITPSRLPKTILATPSSLALSTTSLQTRLESSLNSAIGNDLSFNVEVVSSRRKVALWRTGSWTPCSASCGAGIRLRYVSCRHVDTMKELVGAACGAAHEKPLSREPCQTRPCFGQWRTGDWSKCSSSCGEGMRSRYVGCLYEGRYRDNDDYCISTEKPSEREECISQLPCMSSSSKKKELFYSTLKPTVTYLQAKNETNYNEVTPFSTTATPNYNLLSGASRKKGKWRIGSWSQCSSTCGVGIQKRIVQCTNLIGQLASCDNDTQPISSQKCSDVDCPQWRHGDWLECSRTCGGGNRTRDVVCISSDGKRTEDKQCNTATRPNSFEACNSRSCRRRYHWRKEPWSSCSATCGRGIKTRKIQCFHKKGFIVADELCENIRRKKPRQVHRCSTRIRCPKWRIGAWNKCSSTCGRGIQTRRVTCKYRRKVIIDHHCEAKPRPNNVRSCNKSGCPIFYWNVGPWSQCSASYGKGIKLRSVECQVLLDNKQVNSSVCNANQTAFKPPQQTTCDNGPYASFWATGPWQECSVSCGSGIQQRTTRCVAIHLQNYTEIPARNCDVDSMPQNVRDCNRGSCNTNAYWRVGDWSKCSASCGQGFSMRKVVCFDVKTQDAISDNACLTAPSLKPESERKCDNPLCIPQTCLELQKQYGVFADGEAHLKIHGKIIKIYCKNMNTTKPMEYLTLPHKHESVSEIFGLRLIDPSSCPANGSRLSHCACHRGHPEAGLTTFQKLRIDVRDMRVIGNDYTFATSTFGKFIPFGVAGDCYSRSHCPQGIFHVNLKETNLVVSNKTYWSSFGIHSSMQVTKSHDNQIITGKCGGYCSRCQPDPSVGLLLQHAP